MAQSTQIVTVAQPITRADIYGMRLAAKRAALGLAAGTVVTSDGVELVSMQEVSSNSTTGTFVVYS